MGKQYKVAVIGATGMVGQRFVTLLDGHPWFTVSALAASARSSGKTYAEAAAGRWAMQAAIPAWAAGMPVLDADKDAEEIAGAADFAFCAIALPTAETRALEERYARLECPVVSNNSACRMLPDVPMVIPEVNPGHTAAIESQRKRLGTRRGFIAAKSNCSIQCYVPPLHPLLGFGLTDVLACTYQAVSGSGKTLARMPEIADNVIPYIGGEEEKSEREPLKVWGRLEGGVIMDAASPNITTQCVRVPVSDGHLAAVFARFSRKPPISEILGLWEAFEGEPQRLGLPSAPKRFLHYFEEENRPQPRLDRDIENAMAVSVGRLRPDSQYDIKFICLAHNTVRGAAGGGVLLAELLCAQGYI